MNGGKGRKENLNVPHLHQTENAGFPIAGPETALYGNGVTIVPNVHAVMAWAVSNGRQRGISSEELRNPPEAGEG